MFFSIVSSFLQFSACFVGFSSVSVSSVKESNFLQSYYVNNTLFPLFCIEKNQVKVITFPLKRLDHLVDDEDRPHDQGCA